MAVETQITRPAPFVETLGEDLAQQVVAQTGIPLVTGGIDTLTRQAGETDAGFQARQDAARAFTTRQQNLAGLAPKVAGQDALQQRAQTIASAQAGQTGLASFQPFLNQAQQEATLASGLGSVAFGGLGTAGQELTQAGAALGTAGTTVGGVPLGAQAFQQDVQQFMSPYQSQVIDASLAEFDRNKAIQEQSIRDQQTALGALGSGRAGVQLAEFGTGAARERALLQAGLLQQGFQQAQGARQQDIANRFGLGQAQAGLAGQQAAFAGQRAGLAGATQNLGAFRSQLGGQQAALGQAQEGILGTNISRLGQLGALNQAQQQAGFDATREATRMAAFQPQEQLDRYAGQVAGIMGGYPGQTVTSNIPNPTPLQTALGLAATGVGAYLGKS
jgi:hypothetical protein